jgi:hypothetical protein
LDVYLFEAHDEVAATRVFIGRGSSATDDEQRRSEEESLVHGEERMVED